MNPAPLYCNACGTANQPQARFCFACGQSLPGIASSAEQTVPNALIRQRYHVIAQVGKGGFGAVYKAEDNELGNRIGAVKEMSQRGLTTQEIAEAADAFKREALLLAGLLHPNLPRTYDPFFDAGHWYLVMDFIEGETLEGYLASSGKSHLPVEEVLDIGIQLCTVLDYLHTQQPPIIFRDLKPANVIHTANGHLYLIDFGTARHFKPGQAKDTIAFGSPGYAAPEQYGKAQTTARSDIYSLGANLHQLLTGIDPSQTPFQFAPLQQQGQPIPPGLESLIMQMLEMNENKRPDSVITIKQQLQSIDAQHPIGQINAPQIRVSTQPGATPSNRVSPTQPHSVGAIQHPVTPKIAGSTYLTAKRYREALTAFEQAIQLDPNDAVIYNGKGLALSNLDRHGEALAAFEQAIRLDSNFTNAYANKGMSLYKLKRYQEALAAFEQTIRLNPNFAVVYNAKGLVLLDLGRYEEALTAYEQAIRLDLNFANAYINKGVVHHKLRRYEEALAAYEQAIRLDPKNASIHNIKGTVLGELKRYGEAFAAFDHATRLDPKFASAYSNKGNILCILRRYREALTACERAIRLDINLASAYNNKSVALCGLKRYGEAIGACEQAIQLDPKLAIAYYNKGLALQALGRS